MDQRLENEQSLSDIVREAIETLFAAGALPPGAVLLEAPIADRLGVSRAPVRTALQGLESDGRAHRFDGRGYVLGRAADTARPLRIDLRQIDWPNPKATSRDRRERLASASVLDNLQDLLPSLIPFGRFRISEAGLAEAFGVSRPVAREALFHLLKRGLIDKDPRSHWITGPLTAERTREYFAMRAVLEPLALRLSAPGLDPTALARAVDRAQSLYDRAAPLTVDAFDRLEDDLHETCLSACPNRPLQATLGQTRLPSAANASFVQTMGHFEGADMVAEHLAVLEPLAKGAIEPACAALESHIKAAAERTVMRLKLLSILPYPSLPDFISAADRP